jgi:hypothetical protein
MPSSRHWSLRFLLWAAIFCVLVSLIYMFRSGCAGDTKGGAYGDPIRAMNLEEVGFLIGLVGLVLAALATFTITRLTTRMRISIAVAILLPAAAQIPPPVAGSNSST